MNIMIVILRRAYYALLCISAPANATKSHVVNSMGYRNEVVLRSTNVGPS